MELTFYIAAAVAILSTIMVITRFNLIHALLYLVVSFMAVAVVFFTLGAPFMAALEVIIYAGAIVVLIIFVIMMLNLTQEDVQREKEWLRPSVWVGPAILSAVLLAELVYVFMAGDTVQAGAVVAVDAKVVGLALFGPYVLGVQLSGILLMAGIVGAYHLGRQKKKVIHRFLQERSAAS
ncbi:NADH-quinone oxidoreductase subunit J [Pontibacter akesuensis]|uniref:NADH-quinone oxidoreductase subunit J n=1 Tax=Pontibacter akesuensis TaxID=388950 RepID=A0A1I7FE36_9BACT|nr:NADH-quinone oxidoreductase subunit J [Pontibacter akesuensis]GHA62525.1 NADH:ubiquinone oxidoreductase subunit J [Pontibacter akesuensis]SFU34447.1 NADH dehydrogenase subunit J [Pontibacter akesuensis]